MASGAIARRRAPPRTSSSYVSQLRKALASDDAEASILTRGSRLRAPAAGGGGRRPALRAPGRGGRARAGERRGERRGQRRARALARRPARRRRLRAVRAGPRSGRLEELHLRALELAIDAELAAGRHDEVIARLEALIAEEPLRERLHAQRMLALYRAGRQSEALEAYREARADARSSRSGSSPGPSCKPPPGADPRPGPEPSTRRRRSSSCRSSSRAARRCSPGASASLRWLRTALGARRAKGGSSAPSSGGPPGSARRGSWPSSRPRSRAQGAAVLYAGGGEVADAALATVAEAATGHRPTLLVLDYADDAPPAVLEAAAAARPRARGPAAHGLRPSSRRAGPARLRRPAGERRRPAPAARSAGRGRDRRDRRALRPRRGRRDAAADAARRERRGAASHPPRGRRVGAGGGGRAARRDRRPGGGRSQRAARDRGRARGRRRRPADRPRAHPPLRGRRAARSLRARDLPLPRPGALRRRPRRVLLRPRAPGRRAGRPPGRLDPARGGRPLRQRQVLGRARRPAAGARRRGRPRLGELAAGGDAPGRAPAGRALAGPRPGGARGGARGRRARGSPTRSTGSSPASAWCS